MVQSENNRRSRRQIQGSLLWLARFRRRMGAAKPDSQLDRASGQMAHYYAKQLIFVRDRKKNFWKSTDFTRSDRCANIRSSDSQSAAATSRCAPCDPRRQVALDGA